MHGMPIGRIAGFPVKVDWGVLVILWLFTWSLASTLPTTAAGFSTRTYWVAGACGAVVLLASLLAHELAHAIVARRAGVQVLDVTLWLFGGVTRLGGQATTPRTALAYCHRWTRHEPVVGRAVRRCRYGIPNSGRRADRCRCCILARRDQRSARPFQPAAGCTIGRWTGSARVALAAPRRPDPGRIERRAGRPRSRLHPYRIRVARISSRSHGRRYLVGVHRLVYFHRRTYRRGAVADARRAVRCARRRRDDRPTRIPPRRR